MQITPKRSLFLLPDQSTTWNIDLLLKAIKESKDRYWQAETFYRYGFYMSHVRNNFKSLFSDLQKLSLFDIRTFLWRQFQQHGDYYIDDSNLYYKLSQLVFEEIKNRRDIILIPKPIGKEWKTHSIIFPSLIRDNVYYWTPYSTHRLNNYRHQPKIFLSTLIEGEGTKVKIC